MTRINLVDPKHLADQHLFAEWREIKMIPPALLRSIKARGLDNVLSNIPKQYTLNKGHVTFFYDKMKFLIQRYELLTTELYNRNYNIDSDGNFVFFLNNIPQECCVTEWQPTPAEVDVNVERILLRINERPDWYKFKGATPKQGFFENLYK